MDNPTSSPTKSSMGPIIVLGVLVLGFVGFIVLLMSSNKSSSNVPADALSSLPTGNQAQNQTVLGAQQTPQQTVTPTPEKQYSRQEILTLVKKQIDLPAGNGFVGKITNIEVLKQKNPIFKRAYNGDYVLAYSAKTIIYDPKINVIRDISSETITFRDGMVEVK